MSKVESLERADEVDVASETTDPVVPQPKVLELRQRFEIIRDGLDSGPIHKATGIDVNSS